MISDLPLISVIIPVYNSASSLVKCIESVLRQSYSNIEIIIVNDGSTDSSGVIAEDFAQKDSRIIVVNKQNEGLVLARKSGVDIARGKYIQYLDSDDIMCDGALENLLHRAEDTNAEVVVAPFHICTKDKIEKSLFFSFESLSGIEYLKSMLTWKMHWCVWSKFHLRSLYQNEIERPDISLGEDVVLSTQLLFHAKKVVSIDKEIIEYNFTSSSMSHPDSFNDKKYEDFKRYVKWVDHFLTEKGLSDELGKEIAYFHLKTTLMKLHLGKIADVDSEMNRVVKDVKSYPELLNILTKRESKIIALYNKACWLGYLNLVRYKFQGKI